MQPLAAEVARALTKFGMEMAASKTAERKTADQIMIFSVVDLLVGSLIYSSNTVSEKLFQGKTCAGVTVEPSEQVAGSPTLET